jgi:hypothetical protein
MKNYFLLLSIIVTSLLVNANAGENHARRYRTHYREFDNGFSRQYQYHETDRRCQFSTCMESSFRSSDYVYIEETVIFDRNNHEERTIRVYETERYETHIVTYYVHNEGRKSYVQGRRYNERHRGYHDHYYYYTPYVMPGLLLTSTMMDDFDSESAQVLAAGSIVFDLGLNIAASCRTKECLNVSGDVALLGIASSVVASVSNEVNKNKEKTELEKQIRTIESSSANNVK